MAPVYKPPAMDVPAKATSDEKIGFLEGIVARLRKDLEYFLNNLDSDNMLEVDAAIITNLQAGSILITEGLEARVVLTPDTIAMQLYENGNWVNKVYFDSVSGKYIFDGDLSATTITALQSLFTPNLYAEKAYIAELTVDRLETSDKVTRYLATDQSQRMFIRIQDQYIEFITASTDGSDEQIQNRELDDLYWTDDTFIHVTTEITAYPVMSYIYEEVVKMRMAFDDVNPYIPKLELGNGTGVVGHPDYGKGYIYKATDGLYIEYLHGVTGVPMTIKLTDAGIDFSDFPSITFPPMDIEGLYLNSLMDVDTGEGGNDTLMYKYVGGIGKWVNTPVPLYDLYGYVSASILEAEIGIPVILEYFNVDFRYYQDRSVTRVMLDVSALMTPSETCEAVIYVEAHADELNGGVPFVVYSSKKIFYGLYEETMAAHFLLEHPLFPDDITVVYTVYLSTNAGTLTIPVGGMHMTILVRDEVTDVNPPVS